ncbi:Riboflavin kinase, putative [Perkinsus marinus ATCC 50983]|uniref:riboflavin kinase n=1 Tax=Perkinsus marinus (strain ATCC 50983 / TXsc) TaxID=423536 RepID=C5LGH6_PERM5|nr:Riboflavin kinase, putative [Perkinsus marinus ATCC 50983]EER04162.1 Riboflavin kinase, putative [Perkinsus marinus ATCC 50983]|eukprot:XP_002772346.1 Riboflavin kinase, putative [Perkinsus marinus ATCC 50983]
MTPAKESITRVLHLLEPPARLTGIVASGFGRGSKLLGYPTANITSDSPAVAQFLEAAETGVYLGFAQVRYAKECSASKGDREVHPTALSVGVNPSFNDVKEKLVEAYIMHQ